MRWAPAVYHSYEVGDTIRYKMAGGVVREAIVTAKDFDGFRGWISGIICWGYDRQIIGVKKWR